MAKITASMIKDLRERSGAGMMDCKKALQEADGDMEQAVTILRKKGLAAAGKKAGRITSEGLVGIREKDDRAAMVELNCETDFVARNDDFQSLLEGLLEMALDTDADSAAALMSQPWPGSSEGYTVEQEISARIAKIGENLSFRRFEKMESGSDEVIGAYLHSNGRVGVLVKLRHDGGDANEWKSVARDIAMHAAALAPKFGKRDEVTQADLDTEREIAREQALKAGKPENIVEKIVDGKLEKYYGENVLLEQDFVKDESLTVGKYLEKKAKDAGGSVELTGYTRYMLGEGLEKREDNFAEEVAKQAGV